METKDIVLKSDLLEKAIKMNGPESVSGTYKWYIHIQYITYVEGVACFLEWAADVDNGEDVVSIKKSDLKCLARTLFQIKTYK